jgi:signal transduction histidine kinase
MQSAHAGRFRPAPDLSFRRTIRMNGIADPSTGEPGPIAGGAAPRVPRALSPFRTAVVSIGTIAFAELVAMVFLEVVKPAPFWRATLLDMTIMVLLILPPLFVIVYRPVTRLLERHERAEDALERRTRDLEALYAVTSAATRELDIDRLLSEVLDVLLPAFRADAGWAEVLDDRPVAAFRLVASRDVPEELFGPEAMERRPSCAACRAWRRDPSALPAEPTIGQCERFPGDSLRAAGFVHHWSVVLPFGTRTGAVLNFLWRRPRPCGGAEASLLGAIAKQVAVSARNASLFQAEKNARREADTLRSASLAITRSLDVEAVCTTLLDHLGRLVPFDRAKVMLLETESRLTVRAVFTPSGKMDFPGSPFDSFDVGRNAAVKEVLASRHSVCVDDTFVRAGWGGPADAPVERSWLGVPLLAGGEAIGLYTLVKAEPGFFTPERVRLVEALYAPASVAIANARLYEQLRAGKEEIQSVSRKLVEGQEGERLRVARELHDEAGQLLSSLVLGLRRLENEADRPESVVSHARELKQIADTTQESLHRLASDLRPAALDHLGLVPALGQLAARFSKLGGPLIQLETLGFDEQRLSPATDIALYRIAQEALTNALRHSGARRVSLVVERRERTIVMLVEDDGLGFVPDEASRSGRLGLPGIRERAEMLGGSLLVESSPGTGTTLVVEVPCGS